MMTSQLLIFVLCAFGFQVSNAAEDSNFTYIDNGVLRLGIDNSRGGSIGYLSASGSNDNIVNCYDMGREIQLSFYAGPNFYNPDGKCNKLFRGQKWPWNPIGAGDVKGNHGAVLSRTVQSDNIHIVTKPLQWACDNVPCECEFERNITLGGPAGTGAKVEVTLHNHRADTTVYPPMSQELPAVYSNGPFYRLVTSENGLIKEYNASFDTSKPFPWIPGHFVADENWAALVNAEGFGMGVVNFDTINFIGGFSGKKGTGKSHDASTGYIAPVQTLSLPANAKYSYTFFLVLGNIDTIRSYAKQIRPE